MKRTFYTILMATALALPAGYASADSLLGGAGTAVTGQVGVSTPIGSSSASSNTRVTGSGVGVDVNADTDSDVNVDSNSVFDNSDTRSRSIYNNNADESSFNTETSADMSSSASAGGSVYAPQNLDSVAVRNIQESLNARGYNVGRVDGRWGQSTMTQLRRFENSQSLSQSSSTSLNAETLQQLGVGVNDINPAAGAGANISPAARTMGTIRQSSSYND